jgi:hypothetical protein
LIHQKGKSHLINIACGTSDKLELSIAKIKSHH